MDGALKEPESLDQRHWELSAGSLGRWSWRLPRRSSVSVIHDLLPGYATQPGDALFTLNIVRGWADRSCANALAGQVFPVEPEDFLEIRRDFRVLEDQAGVAIDE